MHLKSMTNYVISQWDKDISREDFAQSMIKYATFLEEPLTLGMFLPTDNDGNVLKQYIKTKDEEIHDQLKNCRIITKEEVLYINAKRNVIFEGFEYKKELRNSGGNYTHFLNNNGLEIYLQWGGFYISGKNENKITSIGDIAKYNININQNIINQFNY